MDDSIYPVLDGVEETGEQLAVESNYVVTVVRYKGLRCAAKTFHEVLFESRRLQDRFWAEFMLHYQLRHPNIVLLLGYFYNQARRSPSLVMELLVSNLNQYINHSGVLPNEISYSILQDVALGLRYLHERHQPIIHRDLTARTVFLTDNMVAKIGNFGCAVVTGSSDLDRPMTPTPGMAIHMPPEAFPAQDSARYIYGIKLDIFSYGVLMIHIFSGEWPCNLKAPTLSEVDRRREYLDSIGHEHPLMGLILQCLSNDPADRPTAADIKIESNTSSHFRSSKLEVCSRRFDTILNKAIGTIPASEIHAYVRSKLPIPESDQSMLVVPFQGKRAFQVIHDHTSYLDYHLVEDMVEKFGDDKLKAEMKVYLIDLEKFRKQTTVSEFVNLSTGKHFKKFDPLRDLVNYSTLTLKMDMDYDVTTLEYIERLRHILARQLSIPLHAMLLYDIRRGSLDVTFLVKVNKDEITKRFTERTGGNVLKMDLQVGDLTLKTEVELLAEISKLRKENAEMALELNKVRDQQIQTEIVETDHHHVQAGNKGLQLAGSNKVEVRDQPEIVETDHHHVQARSEALKQDYLRGVEVIDHTSFIYNGRAQSFVWRRDGFKMHLPKNALPPGADKCLIYVKASLFGQFHFPESTELVSGVYWISTPYKFTKPVTIDIQHCSSQHASRLTYVVAKCTQDLPYNFKTLDGGVFSPGSRYGSINLTQFSGLGIITWPKFPSLRQWFRAKTYCARLYYSKSSSHSWEVYFAIMWDLELYIEAIDAKYSEAGATVGPDQEVEFEGETITLDIPEEGIPLKSGWTITPHTHPGITKRQVDQFVPGRRVPSCQLAVKWIGQQQQPVDLMHRVKLLGAKEPFTFILLQPPSLPPTSPQGLPPPSSQVGPNKVQVKDQQIQTEITDQHAQAGSLVQQQDASTTASATQSTPDISSPRGSQVFTAPKPDLKDLVMVKVKNWYNLGLRLDIKDNDLDTIQSNHPQDQEGCKRDMFKAWLRNCPQASYKQLVQALVELGDVSEADNLCSIYGIVMPQ